MNTAEKTTLPGTLANGTAAGDLWIDTSDNVVFDKVLVVGAAANSNATGTTGLTHYGTQLVYLTNTSAIESNFWAQEIATDVGTTVWALHWNTNNEAVDGAVPVVLKTAAPSTS